MTEVECPDLTSAPYHLAANGLSGSQTLIEIGGPPFLLPLVDRTKIYDLVEISRKVLPNANNLYICGAGAGPHPLINSNCEVSINFVKNKIPSSVLILLAIVGNFQFENQQRWIIGE